jgi:hypothetical protein
MNVFDLLPLVGGWRYEPTTLVDQKITSETSIIDWNGKKGWFLWLAAALNDSSAIIRISTDVYYGKSITSLALYAAGLTSNNNTGVWLSKFDVANSIYVPIFSPPYPLPFHEAIKITLAPSSSGPVTLTNYGHLLITITDEKLFLEDLKRLTK